MFLGPRLIDADMVACADAEVRRLTGAFLDWAVRDVAAAGRVVEGLAEAGLNGGEGADLAALFDVFHNVKGQAGTFGYGAATAIAAIACELLRPAGEAIGAECLSAGCVDALRACYGELLGALNDPPCDESSPVGSARMERLRQVVEQSGCMIGKVAFAPAAARLRSALSWPSLA
ncbi:MAG: Hpt domain-containing protein [Hyphomonadaceae bacterium]